MSETTVFGTFWEAPARSPLCAIATEIVPVDLLTQWRRCGMISDWYAEYLSYAFERRDIARSILSTVVNELVENVAKFSADKLAPARVALEHHGTILLVEARNVADSVHVEMLGAELAELAAGNAAEVFAHRLAERLGLGLALLAKDYGATVGAAVAPVGAGGKIAVCLRVALSAAEVER